ncbi:DUF3373 family protein [Candidatus Sulfurimonas baltica]|uniref:DUF3373 family protein n=1 Tax=Candidatus Sulfurimonas baltica TaxID=2740404 RepID=A0A7S7LVX4_9BACT|nr:DUF3373 family protein [Candidatus Sulfurimonas baltica]QOY52370.1 DUF3373 family protein [Candidatus Sulfurimonas baltica]
MNRPLLLSLAAAALLSTNLSAQSMYERFEAMEKEMNQLKRELSALKSSKSSTKTDEEEQEEVASSVTSTEDETVAVAEDKEEDDGEEIATNEDRIYELEEAVSQLNRSTSGSHLKFKVDYRFAIENMNYTMADGSEAKNNAFMTNRLWINTAYKATNNLSFSAQFAYNKAFGERSGASVPASNSFEGFDWIANENAYDDKLRVRSAYFFYRNTEFMGLDIPWTISIGRRPSTNGHLINLRDDDKASSPLGHAINVEFDGLSSKFVINKNTGTYVKFCAGRGMSNAAPKFSSTPYAEVSSDNTNIDLAGLIFVPFDNKQYSVATQYYYANNLIDAVNPNDQTAGFDTVGGLHSASINFTAKGIGNEWSNFLDDSTFFVSLAATVTDPKDGHGMLGSTDKETGTSYWIGTQFPSLLTESGRWGLEFNHGSKYWRSITYAEDTNIGSKVATRGNAYEAYFTEYLIEDILSLQLRYTYIDYDYSGSNGFFGSTSGNSMRISDIPTNSAMASQVVDKAQDIRFYLRYRY